MTVRELFARMEYSEFREWMVVYREDPWGEERADYRTALLAWQFFNANRGRNQPAKRLEDFLLYRPFREPESEGARILAQARALRARQDAMRKKWRR